MSDTQFTVTLSLVLLVVVLLCGYIVRGKIAQKKNPNGYRWVPEQDYDVVLQGETPMTPGFPVLKKRDKPGPKRNKGTEQGNYDQH